jgi:protein O-GlcNAc transferase
MARTVIEVFLSSTAQDLAPYRMAVRDRLVRTGLFLCVRQEDFGAQDSGAIEFCRKQAQACDMFVGLIGLRRGWEPDGDNERRSITEMEHDWAREGGRRRFLWVMPDDFKLAANMRDPDDLYSRQIAFRKRVMAGGERIVSQKGFDTPELLASEIVEHLLTQVVTGDLIAHVRADLGYHESPSAEEQKPAIAAAVEKLTENKDIDLLALARSPKDVDLADLEAKLKMRAEEHEAEGRRESKVAAEYWRHIGALAFLHNTQKALAAYEKAVELDPDAPDGWRYLGELQYRLGDMAAAERAFEALMTVGTQSGEKHAESLGYLRLGWIHMRRGNLLKAEETQLNALKLNEELASQEGIARAYGNLGIIYQTRGELPKAEEMHLKALKLYEELGRKEGMARTYGNLGLIYRTRSELPKAEEMQLKSLELEEELGNREGMAITYSNLGTIHQTRGELPKAEEMHLKALKLNEELGRKEGMANTYGNLGGIYQARGELPKAEEMQLKALKLSEELGHKEGTATAYGNLGPIYRARGESAKAEETQLKALKLYEELGSKEGRAAVYSSLGVTYDARKNKRRMCECWREGRNLWLEMGLTEKAAEVERWLKLRGCEDT